MIAKCIKEFPVLVSTWLRSWGDYKSSRTFSVLSNFTALSNIKNIIILTNIEFFLFFNLYFKYN